MTTRYGRREVKGKKFTQRDKEIVQAVYEARYLTNAQICRILFTPTTFSWCKTRTRILYDKGFLKKRNLYQQDPDIYFLGVKGRHFVAKTLGVGKEIVDRVAGEQSKEVMSASQMEHETTLGNIYTALRVQATKYGLKYAWKNTRMLELENWKVQPDAWLKVKREEKSYSAFVEFTDVLPTNEEMTGKLDGYADLYERIEPAPILWFTTSRTKVNWIRKKITQSPYAPYILVGLIEDVNKFLTAPMWWSVEDKQVSFVRVSSTSNPQPVTGDATSPLHPSTIQTESLVVGRGSLPGEAIVPAPTETVYRTPSR
jgi:hypothetical protein